MKKHIITIILIVLIILAFGVMLYAGYNAYTINRQYKEARSAYDNIADQVVKPYATQEETTGTSGGNEQETDPCPITVEIDFDRLLSVNSDVVGWLYYKDGLNYPVVQGNDNSYYLHKLYDKSYSYSGVPFLDCRMTKDFSDKINLIYGHNMRDGSMFNVLEKYKDGDYLENHQEIQLLTPTKNYILHVLSAQLIHQSDKFYDLQEDCLDPFLSEEDLLYDKYVILSTCSYEYSGARTIVICRAEEIC